MRLKGDQGTARALNRRLILNLLRQEGAKSRAELAVLTGLSPATVTFVVADLIEEGIVIEGAASRGATGRRPIPLEINYAGGFAVGLKFMVGRIGCVLTDLSTTPIASMTVPVADESPQAYVAASADAVKQLLRHAKRASAKVMGIGVAMPGIIDIATGTCRRSHRFNWDNVAFASMLAERVRIPVWLDDDTNAFALAQQLFGLGRQHRTVGALAIGAGISCAVVVGGTVHHGSAGAAGKLGHCMHDRNGPLCECGRRGCLQAMYSETAIVQRWQGRRRNKLNRSDMLKAIEAGDNEAVVILQEAGQAIGRHLAEFCNVVDPELIVVGGEAVAFGDHLLNPLRDSLAEHVLTTAPPVLPDWQPDSWERGAAALATQQLFDFEAVSGLTRQA